MNNDEKLREALMKCLNYIDGATDLCKEECEAIASFMKDALAAPARNCDRFASCEDACEAYRAYEEDYILRSNNVFDSPLQFTDWLFAEAKGITE